MWSCAEPLATQSLAYGEPHTQHNVLRESYAAGNSPPSEGCHSA